MNAVIISTAIRQKECTHALKLVLKHTPEPRRIILIQCVGKPEFDSEWPRELAEQHPEVIFHKTDGTGGLTGAWNLGFRLAEGCDAIVCMNDDVFVNNTWPNIFDTIRANVRCFVGPVSKKPGVDYTNHQKQDGPIDKQWTFGYWQQGIKDGGVKTKASYFCVNGFCWGLSGSLCRDLTLMYGSLLNEVDYPWGGQEEDLGRRVYDMGGILLVDGRTYVDHLKFSDWRTHKLTSPQPPRPKHGVYKK
jgi:GT2 family glycosyltransferase